MNEVGRRQCTAHKKDGERCKRAPIKGGTVCPKHGGGAKQVREAAQRRLLEAADGLMANLLKIALSGESEANRLRATMDALSRAGLVERHIVHVGTTDPFSDLLADILDEVLVDSSAQRALPAPTPDDEEDGSDRRATWDGADDEPERELSFRTDDTVPGEVVHTITTVPPRSSAQPPAYLRSPADRGRGDFSR